MTTTKNTPGTNNGTLVNSLHVEKLITHYKQERWAANSQKLGKADSLSTWYGMEELQNFLDLSKEHQADGIKMYFGVYPADYEAVPEFRGRQTVILVATKKNRTDQGVNNKDIYVKRNGRLEILGFNMGQICPPWCTMGLSADGQGNSGIDLEKIGISLVESDNQIIVI